MGNIKFGIIRVTADGEQCNLELDASHDDIATGPEENYYDALVRVTGPFFKLMDDRQFEMNCRILASNELAKRLEPKAQQAIHVALEHLMGQAPKTSIDKLVEEGQERRQRENEEAEKARVTSISKKAIKH